MLFCCLWCYVLRVVACVSLLHVLLCFRLCLLAFLLMLMNQALIFAIGILMSLDICSASLWLTNWFDWKELFSTFSWLSEMSDAEVTEDFESDLLLAILETEGRRDNVKQQFTWINKSVITSVPVWNFIVFSIVHIVLILLSSPVPKPFVPKPPRPNPNQVLIRSKTKGDWG